MPTAHAECIAIATQPHHHCNHVSLICHVHSAVIDGCLQSEAHGRDLRCCVHRDERQSPRADIPTESILQCITASAVFRDRLVPTELSHEVGPSINIAQALSQLTSSNKSRCEGRVLSCTPQNDHHTCKLRLDLYVRAEVLEGLLRWDAGRAAADVFARLIPVTDATRSSPDACPDCAEDIQSTCVCKPATRSTPRGLASTDGNDSALSPHANTGLARGDNAQQVPEDHAASFKLHECFEELPNLVTTPVEYPPAPPRRNPGKWSTFATPTCTRALSPPEPSQHPYTSSEPRACAFIAHAHYSSTR